MKEFVLKGGGVKKNFSIDYKNELNKQQLDVVFGAEGPSLVLAGAGSGKTRTITYRVAYLLEQGIEADNILLLTFTNKASKEMVNRTEELLGTYPKGLWAGTFHSVSNRILRLYGRHIGFEPNFSILDQDNAKDLIALCLKELGIDRKEKRFPSASAIQDIISFQRNKHVLMKRALELKNPGQLVNLNDIENIATKYAQAKKAQNVMDFDDILLNLLALLQQRPDILDSLANQFRYVLVDEFQDTNVIQAEIVRLLSSVHENLLVVGDDAQSIYSFRAADIGNILDFPQKNNKTKIFNLTQNYRSTPEVLDIANAVITKNTKQFKKTLTACKDAGTKPCLVVARHPGEEAQYITEQILDLYQGGTKLSEIAVLFRAAFHSQALEFELMKQNLPYDYRGGMRFFERSHIKDVVAHLRVIENVKDVMAWIRTLTIHPGIGLATAQKIANHCAQFSTVDEAINSEIRIGKKAASGWSIAKRMWKDILSGPKLPAAYIQELASNKDYIAYLENEFPNFRDRLDDLDQFIVFAEEYNEMRAFLDDVSLTEEYGSKRVQAGELEDRLVLSTIHQAKGLEWDTVFVIKLNDGSFPHNKVLNEEGGLEEERRLFYVAITRARNRLFLTYPLVAGFQHQDLQTPSIFLDEIPKKLYEEVKSRHSVLSSSSSGWSDDSSDEPAIVLDDIGETIRRPAPTSFLRDINDL
ncbi:ATP-dependent helicase [Patescibacteria group bacterium]|nr:ATP-dependent helicase [Patescibacteria group bacterium]